MLEISDNKIWQVCKTLYDTFKGDQQRQRLDPQDLKEFKKNNIKPLYPHKVSHQGTIEKYSCREACCIVEPGSFCCCKTTQPDHSFRKLGLGLCLLFKFMKHFSTVFMAIAVISIFSCMICYLVTVENSINTTENYQNFLFSTTLGSFSSQKIKCQYQKLPNIGGTVQFVIQCPYGKIESYGATYSYQSSNTLLNCRNQMTKIENNQDLNTSPATATTCNTDNSKCTITYPSVALSSNYTTMAYSFSCLNQVYTLGPARMQGKYLLYVVVGLDLICCIILSFFYVSEGKAQELQITYFKQRQLGLSDFSLKIKGLNLSTFEQEFNDIFETFSKKIGGDFVKQLIQVKTPDRVDFISYQNQKIQAYQNLYQFIVEHIFDDDIHPNKYKDSKEFITKCFTDTGDYEKFKSKLTIKLSQFKLLNYQPDEDKANKKCSIFIVLNSIRVKKRIYELQEDGCFSKYYKINNKQYILSQPPPPDLIIWKNKGKITFFRSILTWLITLIICFGSYMLFGYLQYLQNSFLSDYNFQINCSLLYTSAQLLTYNPIAGDSNYLTCFCLDNLLSFNSQCTQLQKKYFTYLSIPLIISVSLVIYNVIVSAFFKVITRFQAHRLVTDELFSYTIKRSFLLIMNMGLIMIILNMKYTNSFNIEAFSFLLQGKYKDVSPDWYLNIGTIIIMTMIFNISFPIIQLMLSNILKCFRRCWDRKLCFRKTSCKTKTEYVELYKDDIYPIQERYAFLISVILITLAFSCIIPILNVICGISMMLLYFSDRLLIFKVFQVPVNYGSELHKLINKTIYLALIAHFALTAFFLSQARLVAGDSSFKNIQNLNVGNQRINTMVTTYYIVPYVALFILFVGWAVFDNTIVALCNKCSSLCKKSLSNITKYKLQQKFFDIISQYQLSKVKMMVQSQIQKQATKKQAYQSIKSNKSSMQTSMKGLNLQIQTNQSHIPSQYQNVLRRTYMRLKTQQQLRKKQRQFNDAYLMGLPSYQQMVSQQAFQQIRKCSLLNATLSDLLKQQLQQLN